MQKEYIVFKQGWKYYIVPDRWSFGFLPHPDNFVSFFRESKAKRVCAEMNAAYISGYITRALKTP